MIADTRKMVHDLEPPMTRTYCPNRVWIVWVPAMGRPREDAVSVAAPDATAAAERFAERDDYRSADFTFAKGSDDEVYVSEYGSDVVHIFTITAEMRPTYHARRKS